MTSTLALLLWKMKMTKTLFCTYIFLGQTRECFSGFGHSLGNNLRVWPENKHIAMQISILGLAALPTSDYAVLMHLLNLAADLF